MSSTLGISESGDDEKPEYPGPRMQHANYPPPLGETSGVKRRALETTIRPCPKSRKFMEGKKVMERIVLIQKGEIGKEAGDGDYEADISQTTPADGTDNHPNTTDDSDDEISSSPVTAKNGKKGNMRQKSQKRKRGVSPAPKRSGVGKKTSSTVSSSRGKKSSALASLPGTSKMVKGEAQTSDSDEEDDQDYEVDSILDVRTTKEFLVKWKGYHPSHDSWEPEANLQNCRESIREFESKKRKGSKSQRAAVGGKSGSKSKKDGKRRRRRRFGRY